MSKDQRKIFLSVTVYFMNLKGLCVKQITSFASDNLSPHSTYTKQQRRKKLNKQENMQAGKNYGAYKTIIHLSLKMIRKFLLLKAWLFQFVL